MKSTTRGIRDLYRTEERAGCVELRQRANGAYVGVYRAKDAEVDDDDGQNPWSTICEEHANIIAHATRAVAEGHAVEPEYWCEGCDALARAVAGGARLVRLALWEDPDWALESYLALEQDAPTRAGELLALHPDHPQRRVTQHAPRATKHASRVWLPEKD